jgi:hypothetical protein
MAFKVWLGSDEPQVCGDDDVYDFSAAGVLAVHYAEPGKWSQYYPPAKWQRVDAALNHPPGEAVNRSIGGDFD